MEKKTYPGIRAISRINQTAVPYKVIQQPTKLDPTPKLLADFSGFDMYQTVLMNFAKELFIDYPIDSEKEIESVMEKAHKLTEHYFMRIEKTSKIMSEISAENKAKKEAENKNNEKPTLIVEP